MTDLSAKTEKIQTMLLGHNSNPLPMPKEKKKETRALSKTVLFRVEDSV